MVLVDDKKYACEACIKGHRSSSCKHTDRPLYEIKKKGRPVTQCEHCRELRKTKQVHVKCMCEVKPAIGDKTPAAGSSKKGNLKKVLASATFPEGLPEALGSSVAQHASSEDISSDSEQGDGSSNLACNCKNGDECHCFTTRTRRKKPGPESRRGSTSYAGNLAEGLMNGPGMSRLTLNGRVGDLRPVPPRSFLAPETDPSFPPHPHMHPSAPRTSHGASYFNPYGRAYEEHFHLPESIEHRTFDTAGIPGMSLETSQSTEQLPDTAYPNAFTWPEGGPGSIDLSAFCTCGDSCSCAGCVQRRDSASWPEGTCISPGTCATCITCSLPIAFGPTTPPTTPSTGFDPPQFEPLDDWIRSISTITPPTPAFYQPDILDDQTNAFFNGIPRIVEPGAIPDASHSSPSDRCNGRCKCSLGQCTCPPDCCGCCQGCQCEDHDHESQPVTSGGDGTFTSYAVSGERTPCCGPNSTSVSRSLCPAPPASTLSRVSSTSSRGSLPSMSSSGPPSLNPSAHFPPRQRPILPKASSTTSLLMNAEPSSARGTWSQSTTDVTSRSAFPQQAMGAGARLEGSYQDRTQRAPYDSTFSSIS